MSEPATSPAPAPLDEREQEEIRWTRLLRDTLSTRQRQQLGKCRLDAIGVLADQHDARLVEAAALRRFGSEALRQAQQFAVLGQLYRDGFNHGTNAHTQWMLLAKLADLIAAQNSAEGAAS